MRSLSFLIIVFTLFTQKISPQSPHGDNFDVDCSFCHDAASWNVDLQELTFDHSTTNFSLIGQHQNVDCRSCHLSLKFSDVVQDCISCHKDIHSGTTGSDCSSCHTSDTWIVKDIISIHQQSRFPLAGNHKTADCMQCHSGYTELNFEPLGINCFDCHSSDYYSTENPNHPAAGFSTDCNDCHTINSLSWNSVNVVHDFFPLVGGHNISDCFSCHEQGGNFTGLSTECFTCHEADFNAAQNPDHIDAGFPTDCSQCHNVFAFIPASFDHNITDFPLTGQHIGVSCQNCHSAGYSGTSTDCYDCHQQDFELVTDPNHIQAGFATTCQDCHTTVGWIPALFDHNLTDFPLTGAHISQDCSSCHAAGYTGTPTECYACHQDDYDATVDPNHTAAAFPTTCSDCHTTSAWEPAQFDHDGLYFPIYSGEHNGVWNNCSDCHTVQNNFSIFSCIDCHEHNQLEMDDKHQGISGYAYESNACLACHPNGEKEGAFNHNNSFFILDGAHIFVECSQCHQSGYAGTPSVCSDCHQSDYNAAQNPDHSAAGISVACSDCHTTSAWIPSDFIHSTTGFELTGQHLTLECSSCHVGTTSGLTNECYSCHLAQYNNAPNHTVQNYPTNCELCHNSTEWSQVSFDHQITGFPLTGAHSTSLCSDCHESGYAGTSGECSACHQNQYNQSLNPDHTALSLSTDCQTCHSANPGWTPALFPDHNSYYQLTGAHLTISNDCSACHNGNYNSTPVTCIGCHQDNFNLTNDPPHVQLSFSIECLDCHTMSGWTNAVFNHTFYPLSGEHSGFDCSECHSQASYQPDCLTCHLEDFLVEHQQGDPTDCWNCHTTNDWDDGTLIRPLREKGVRML